MEYLATENVSIDTIIFLKAILEDNNMNVNDFTRTASKFLPKRTIEQYIERKRKILELEIVSIRFPIRPPIAIRSESKSIKVWSRSKIFDRNPAFSDFDRQSKFRSGLPIFCIKRPSFKTLQNFNFFFSIVKITYKLNV